MWERGEGGRKDEMRWGEREEGRHIDIKRERERGNSYVLHTGKNDRTREAMGESGKGHNKKGTEGNTLSWVLYKGGRGKERSSHGTETGSPERWWGSIER